MAENLFLVYNARIWTGQNWDASWMTFDRTSGFIRQVGTTDPPTANFSEEARKDYGDQRIFPGFHESHIHVSHHGRVLLGLDLTGCKTIEELQDSLACYVKENHDFDSIVGYNYDETLLGRHPTRDDLDAVCKDRPVLLYRICIHMAVTNSNALQLFGIESDTQDPDGGEIDRYPAGHLKAGQPNGVIRENALFKMAEPKMAMTSEQTKKCIKAGLDYALHQGVTSAHSNEHANWQEWCQLAESDELPIRVFYAGYVTGKDSGNFPRYPGESHGKMLSCDRIKVFTDGALGAQTAAITEPYMGTCRCGLMVRPQACLETVVHEMVSLGFRLEVHVIGDAAVDAILEALRKAHVPPEKRPILTHCQIVREDQLLPMKEQGVIANIQPQFVLSDSRWLHKLLPESLQKYAYAWKTLLDNGIVCAGGSDAPIEVPHPMFGIYDAIFRPVGIRAPSGEQEAYKPEECLTVRQAIDLYTKAGAYTAMREHCLGQLLPGYKADFVVIDNPRDLVEHPRDFASAKVGEVWVDGKRKL